MDQAVSFSSVDVNGGRLGGTIRIFKPGSFTSVDGSRHSFTRDDLVQAAAAYDPEGDPAPLVIGHPLTDHPAYGWATGLRMDGDELVADVGSVAPEFAEAVNAGRYRKVSASWYPPSHHGNPKPGIWYLKHIGFLGAAAPALKGLGTVSLAEGGAAADLEGLVSFALFDPDPSEPEPKQEESFVTTKTEDKPADFAERQAALDQREAALKQREADIEKAAADARHADHVSFAEGMIAKGVLAPAGKGLLIGVLDQLGATVEPVSFGEAGADKMPPVAALKKLLGGAKPLVSFAELAPRERASGKNGGDVDPTELAREAASFAEAEGKAGRPISIAAAVRHIQSKGE